MMMHTKKADMSTASSLRWQTLRLGSKRSCTSQGLIEGMRHMIHMKVKWMEQEDCRKTCSKGCLCSRLRWQSL